MQSQQYISILIIEDNPIDQLVLKENFKRTRLPINAILVASTMYEALSILNTEAPSIIFLDLFLPDTKGLESFEQLSLHNSKIPVIICSSISDNELTLKAISLGAQDFLIKGHYDFELLEKTIRYSIERKKNLEIIRESNDRYNALAERQTVILNSLPSHITVLDENADIVEVNHAAKEFAAINPLIITNDFVGKNYVDIAESFGAQRCEAGEKLAAAIRRINAGKENEFFLEYWCPGAEGPVWFRVNITRLNKHVKGGIVISHTNITETKLAEEKIKESNGQLRLLASHLQNIREEERANIAREVHDELGQQLTGLKMDVAWMKKKINAPGSTAINEKINSLLEMIDTAVSTVRRISSELRPGIIDDFGLQAAMEWHAGEFTKRTGIPCQLTIDFTEDIADKKITIALFRIFQESLTNVARHANATHVSTQLKKEGANIVLVIKDDGVGMNTEIAKSKRTLGLMGMKERSYMINGSYNIYSEPGLGTTITVQVPYLQSNF